MENRIVMVKCSQCGQSFEKPYDAYGDTLALVENREPEQHGVCHDCLKKAYHVGEIDTKGNWKLYWGEPPIPHGMEPVGTVKRDIGDVGACFLSIVTGRYYQGNAGTLRSLPDVTNRDVMLANLAEVRAQHLEVEISKLQAQIKELRQAKDFILHPNHRMAAAEYFDLKEYDAIRLQLEKEL